MKKYLLGLFAVVLAVGFSAFTVAKVAPKQQLRYAIHNGTAVATEKTFTAYSFQVAQPTLACPGAVITCWFSVPDLNGNGTIEAAEFNARANALDTDADGQISDNQVETPGVYQEKL